MRTSARIGTIAIFFALVGVASADHKSGATLAWHVVSGGLDESRVSLYKEQRLVGIFDIACDLTAAVNDDLPDNGVALQLARPASSPGGLLIVTCNVGAHSQHIAIIDPDKKTHHPVYSRTGSFFVDWEIQDGELWISFDRACDTGPTVECPDGFETLFEPYPPTDQ